MTDPVKPPSLHDILNAAGDLNTLKAKSLRLLCNALIAFAFEAQRKQTDAEAREQATYLALVRRGQPSSEGRAQLNRVRQGLLRLAEGHHIGPPSSVATFTVPHAAAEPTPHKTKRVRGAATTALLRKCRKGKAK